MQLPAVVQIGQNLAKSRNVYSKFALDSTTKSPSLFLDFFEFSLQSNLFRSTLEPDDTYFANKNNNLLTKIFFIEFFKSASHWI